MQVGRAANLLGAVSLAVHDVALAGATAAAGTSESGAAALVVLSTAPGLGVSELGRRVGLSQSAAVRMVDSLTGAGLVERRPGSGRSVTVHLTTAGGRVARHLLAERGYRLTEVVAGMEPADQETLARLLGVVLERLYERIGDADRMCRLCDRPVCIGSRSICPVGAADRARHDRADG